MTVCLKGFDFGHFQTAVNGSSMALKKMLFHLKTIQYIFVTLLAGSQVSDRCPFGCLYLFRLKWPPFGERAAHSVNRMFTLICLFVSLVVSDFGFEGRALVLIASVPGHCLPFTFNINSAFWCY